MRFLLVLILSVVVFAADFCLANSLIFRFQGLSKAESRICLDIFEQSESEFFLKPEKLNKRVVEPFCFEVSQTRPVYQLKNLKPGKYSAAFFEDLEGDGKIRLKSLLGIPIPVSPIGFTQNPLILFGPPSFNSCAVEVENEPKELVVEIKRIF